MSLKGNFLHQAQALWADFSFASHVYCQLKERHCERQQEPQVCVWGETGWRTQKTNYCLTGFCWKPSRGSNTLKHCKLLEPQKSPISAEFLLAIISPSAGKSEKRHYDYVKWQGKGEYSFQTIFPFSHFSMIFTINSICIIFKNSWL